MWDELDLVIDGGRIAGDDHPGSRLGSTVVNLAKDGKFSIVRPGRYTWCISFFKPVMALYTLSPNVQLLP